MRKRIFLGFFILSLLSLFMTVSVVSAASVEDKRNSVRKMADTTLNKLYDIHPSSRAAVENAAGYAVFNITDAKLIFVGGGGGKGLAVNNFSGQETFMKTAAVQLGLGLGVKRVQVVFVFETEKAFADFTNKGWEVGGQGTIAATDSVNGASLEGAVSAGKNVWMYQMTDKGLEISLTVRGIRYYRDGDLN